MTFQLIWTNRARKDLKKLEKPVAERIIREAELLSAQETVFLEKLTGSEYYKLRVGDCRIIIIKFSATQKLAILKVGHRKNIYDRI
ncbi:MAG: type II toxin-antitoxin system RelE/ParE family toxin [Candidatus Diapherotrites archaeon]|nr:type II toxin-antitoxin system RelE/ParE family toxin [Candidatus Diapherotrites archaeon]